MILSRLLLAACALWGASGCYINTQRYPRPMRVSEDLPEGLGAVFAPGPEEALVVRHADPVLLRRAGEDSGFPLRFYSKTARVNSGSWVQCGAGGRAEVVFPGDGYLILTGRATAVLGSPGRGEPVAAFLQVSRAEIQLVGNDYCRLLGGALLSGEGGPYVVESERDDVLSLTNRSRGPATVAFRESTMVLAPGEVVHLPLLEAGGAPRDADPGFARLEAAGAQISLRGGLTVAEQTDERLVLQAEAGNEIRAFGTILRVDPGDTVVLDSLGTTGNR